MRAEGRDRLGHAGLDLCLARHVHGDADRILAAELRGRRVGAGLIEIGDHDLGAFAHDRRARFPCRCRSRHR